MIENEFFLMDLERTISRGITYYWKSGQQNYTTNILEAGLYLEETATEIVKEDFDKKTVMIPFNMVKDITGLTASEYETAQVDAIYGHRLNTNEFVTSGPEAAQKAIELFRARKDQYAEFLQDDEPDTNSETK